MNIIQSSIFRLQNFALHFSVFKFWRLQIFATSVFLSSNFGYFNRVAAHSTFHALKLPRLTASLRKSKGNHGGQGIPYRWGGPGELWNVAPERSMNIISSSFFRIHFSSSIFRLQFLRFKFPVFNFSLQYFSLHFFRLQTFAV